MRLEEARGLVVVVHQRLGHRVEERRRERRQPSARGLSAGGDAPGPAPLDASHRREAADVGDVGRLRRPGRDRAGPWHREESLARRLRRGAGIEVEEPLEHAQLVRLERAIRVDEMQVFDGDAAHRGVNTAERREQALDPEAGECWSAPEPQHQAVSASRPGRRRPGTG